MKSEAVLNAVTITGGELPKGEQVVLTAFIEDTKKLDNRMTALETKVTQLDEKIDNVLIEQQAQKQSLEDTRESVDRLVLLVEASIKKREEQSKILTEVLNSKFFWVWLCLFTLLGFGATVSDIGSIFHLNW